MQLIETGDSRGLMLKGERPRSWNFSKAVESLHIHTEEHSSPELWLTQRSCWDHIIREPVKGL